MKKAKKCTVRVTKTDIFVDYDGVRIAQRGKPGTRQAGTWISLEPGYNVYDTADMSEIVIARNGTRIH